MASKCWTESRTRRCERSPWSLSRKARSQPLRAFNFAAWPSALLACVAVGWAGWHDYRVRDLHHPHVPAAVRAARANAADPVESGSMTKVLALLVGDTQGWLTTEGFIDKVALNLDAALAKAA